MSESILRALRRWLRMVPLATALIVVLAGAAIAVPGGANDTPLRKPGAQPLAPKEATGDELLERDLEFMSRRTAGDTPLDNQTAGQLRAAAVRAAKGLQAAPAPGR